MLFVYYMYVITMVLLIGNFFSPQCLFMSWNIKLVLLVSGYFLTWYYRYYIHCFSLNDILPTPCTLFVCKYLMLLVRFHPDKIL